VGVNDDDVEEDNEKWATDGVEVVAEAGEFETTTGYRICINLSPTSKEAVRVTPSVAKREKLVSD
jgi:hypothetical protein